MISIEHVPDDEPLLDTSSPMRERTVRCRTRNESRHAFAPHPLNSAYFVDHLI